MNLMRAAKPQDLPQLLALAQSVSPGMTTFPPNEAVLREKIESATKSFSGQGNDYLMVLEDTKTNTILGTSAVYADIGQTKPFYSFAMLTRTQYCYELERRSLNRTLHVVNEYTGDCEVGTLILAPQARGAGLGRLLSKCRYMLLAQFREKFGPRVIAELRGWSNEKFISPFWESVGRHFFSDLSYPEADYLSATTNNQFIADLMPEYPIYVDLLPAEAQAVIGKPHKDGVPALNMLLKEGFRWENIIDIFDGGPTVHARIEDLFTVQKSYVVKIDEIGKPILSAKRALVCNTTLSDFRVIEAVIGKDALGQLILGTKEAEALRVAKGESIRVLTIEAAE